METIGRCLGHSAEGHVNSCFQASTSSTVSPSHSLLIYAAAMCARRSLRHLTCVLNVNENGEAQRSAVMCQLLALFDVDMLKGMVKEVCWYEDILWGKEECKDVR
jgi:hypothetical protein